MKLELNTLKCVKLLIKKGFERPQAEALAETITGLNIRNIYEKEEVNTMLTEAMERILKEEACRRKEDARRNERELDILQRRLDNEYRESIVARRWMTGIIITCTLGLAGYLSALIHLIH